MIIKKKNGKTIVIDMNKDFNEMIVRLLPVFSFCIIFDTVINIINNRPIRVVLIIFAFLILFYELSKIYKKLAFIRYIYYYIGPVIAFLGIMELSSGYYSDEYSERIKILMIIVFAFYFLLYLSDCMKKLIKSIKKINSKYLVSFVLAFIQSLNLFVAIYCIVFITYKDSFTGIDVTNPFSISVDLLLFATQNFVFQNIIPVAPTVPISKLIVVIEILYFSLFVSLVLFNLISNRNSKQDESRKSETTK